MITKLNPITKNAIPVDEYVYPCLPWANYNTRAGKFLDPLYYNQLGSEHPGQDINGNGGGNTDLGLPIYAITKGTVVKVGNYRSWGNVVLIYHEGPKVWSQYAHLQKTYVAVGDKVKARTIVGTLGRGERNAFLAHLHFEIRYKDIPASNWPSAIYTNRWQAQKYIKENYHDPVAFLERNKAKKL